MAGTTVTNFAPILGKRIRITKLDSCGSPGDAAADEGFIATGFISLSLSVESEDGSEIITKKADGSLCINMKLSDSIKRLTVELELCGVNGELTSWMTSAKPYLDGEGTNVIGFVLASGEVTTNFALEVWTGIDGAPCEDGNQTYGYLLLPFVNGGMLDDLSIDDENAISFKVKSAYTKDGNKWDVGPYNVYNDGTAAGPLPTALDPKDHLLMIETNTAPPEENEDPQTMPVAP